MMITKAPSPQPSWRLFPRSLDRSKIRRPLRGWLPMWQLMQGHGDLSISLDQTDQQAIDDLLS